MQGPRGRLPASRLLCGLSGAKHHRRLRATTPDFHPPGRRRSDIDDSYALSRAWMTFRWPDFSGVLVNTDCAGLGRLLGGGQDRDGPLGWRASSYKVSATR